MKKFGTYIVSAALLCSFVLLNYNPAEAFHHEGCDPVWIPMSLACIYDECNSEPGQPPCVGQESYCEWEDGEGCGDDAH